MHAARSQTMKTKYKSLKLITLLLVTFFIQTISNGSPSPADPSAACVLNITHPLEPTGECIGHGEKINVWGSFPTTLCCRNALTILSRALASHLASSNSDGRIFVTGDQWTNCSTTYLQPLIQLSQSCTFGDLVYGSSRCSNLTLSDFEHESPYQDAVNKCTNLGSSFKDGCGNCSAAILEARDHLYNQNNVKSNGKEKAVCGVALVVYVAAGTLRNSLSFDDFFRCLPALDVIEPGYIKINSSMAKALLAVLMATVGLMLVILLVKYVTSKSKHPKPLQAKEIVAWSGLYRFSKAEIENAINFANERKSLGRGSAGHVYKGLLPSGQAVAIKHIDKNNKFDSFTREVDGLSRIRHPNLVSLFGCCVEGGEHYLVYEYCSAGNLAQHLLRKNTVLPWDKRVKILRDCALALRYLHRYPDGCIVHRDIKLTNILLTEKLEPKLSDFGLAKMLEMEESKVFTDVRGTVGYMDPEYMSNAKLTCASDIYSFGIVALQLLSGQKVFELDLDARDQLTRKAKDVNMGRRPLSDFEDPRLTGNLNVTDFESILQVAVLCVAKSSKGRPTIDIVLEEINKACKNTVAEMRAKREMGSLATSQSRSFEVIPV